MKNKKSTSKELKPKRVQFKSALIRNQFFSLLKFKYKKWVELGKEFNIYKSRLEHFRNGVILIPLDKFLELLSELPKKYHSFFHNQIILRNPNWGCKKGGLITLKKHPYILEEGRAIARKQSKPIYHFNLNVALNEEICEFIGSFIGDGFTNKYKNVYITQFTGHAKLDNKYLSKQIKQIVKNLSPKSNPIIFKKDNVIRLTINSKELFLLLTKRFKLPRGKKCYSVIIPFEILDSGNQKFINACIRGIFDTDGSVYFDKRDSYKKPYLRIGLHMCNKELLKQVQELLIKQGIVSTITRDSKKIQINGFEACKKFVENIGFSNSRHFNKLKHTLY